MEAAPSSMYTSSEGPAGLCLPPPTCWSANPIFRIDWLLVRVPEGCAMRVAVRRHTTIAAAEGVGDASDHRPVVVDLDLEVEVA